MVDDDLFTLIRVQVPQFATLEEVPRTHDGEWVLFPDIKRELHADLRVIFLQSSAVKHSLHEEFIGALLLFFHVGQLYTFNVIHAIPAEQSQIKGGKKRGLPGAIHGTN